MTGANSTVADLDVDLRQLFTSLARNWRGIAAVTLAVTMLAFAGAWMAAPHYKAETRLLIETRESIFTRPNVGGEGDRPILDEEEVASQVEVISSTEILKRVAQQLDLSKLPEFDNAAAMSLPGRLLVMAGLKTDPSEIAPDERVLKKMREKLNVYRVDRSRVIVIEFSSKDPKLAAEIPNAIADAYIAVQRGAKQEQNAAATDWLAPEIADLSRRVKEAEAKVAAYRGQADLLIGQNSSVLATQQLSEMSSELSRVRAARASAEATAASVRSALRSGGSLASLPEVLSSNLIQRLRERQVQLNSDIADLSTTLLDNHPRLRALRSQLADLDRQIRDEAEKVLAGLDTEARTAKAREDQIVADLNKLKAQSAHAGEQQVELNALEREANAQRQLLESYMTRYREASSREDRAYLPVDARIFSRAATPAEPYFPKIAPIVGAAFTASLLVMGIATLLAELFSGRAMRPAADARPQPPSERVMEQAHEQQPAEPALRDLPPSPPERAAAGETLLLPDLGQIGIEEAARKIIAAGAARAVFVSPEGDEAAASSVLVAREMADAGLRVLLLDLTVSGAASRAMLDTGLLPGITDLLASQAQFSDIIHADHYSDCHVVPAGTADPERAMRAADRLPLVMQSLTSAYDVVVLECGPADATGIRRLVTPDTEVFVSLVEAADDVTTAAVGLIGNGYPDLTLVTPAGHPLAALQADRLPEGPGGHSPVISGF